MKKNYGFLTSNGRTQMRLYTFDFRALEHEFYKNVDGFFYVTISFMKRPRFGYIFFITE